MSLRIRSAGIIAAGSVLLAAAVASGSDGLPPERLLGENLVAYWRFDGWDAHQAALDQTTFGELLQGDLGRFLEYLRELTINQLRGGVLRASLLEGQTPDYLLAIQTAANQLPAWWDSFRKNGFVAGVDVGIQDAASPPLIRLPIVLPQGKPLQPAVQVLLEAFGWELDERLLGERAVLVSNSDEWGARLAAWVDGDDLAICIASDPIETIVARAAGLPLQDVTHNRLYQLLADFKEYETISRGFVDFARLAEATREDSTSAYVREYVAAIGLGNVRQIVWHSGYGGRHQRSTVQVLLPGERTGLLRLLGGAAEQGAADQSPDQLPPLPPDAMFVHAFKVNPSGLLEGLKEVVLGLAPLLGDEVAEQARSWDESQQAMIASLGIDLQLDLLATLGQTMVFYAAPSEGIFSLGAGLGIQVTDADKLRQTLAEIERGIVSEGVGQVKASRRDYHGTELVTLVFAADEVGPFPFTPAYAIHAGWLVVALNPQTVMGFILRTEGRHEVWRPSPLGAEVLAAARQRSPQCRVVALLATDPRPRLKFMLSLAPLLGSYFANAFPDTFDNSMLPDTQSVIAPLYPNVSLVIDEGDSLRYDSYKSAPFPFDGNLFVAYPLLMYGPGLLFAF